MILWLVLTACSGSEKTDDTGAADTAGDTSGDTSADTDTSDPTADTDTGGDSETATACDPVNAGDDWAWAGACPQMTTPVAITVDACTLTLDYDAVGGMTMGMPYAATIVGDQVTFADDNAVDGCVGTIVTADKITGSCADGCTFTLKR